MSAAAAPRTGVRVSLLLAVGAALSVLSAVRTGWLAVGVAALGLGGLVAGLLARREGPVVVGGAALFASAVLAATASAPVLAVLTGAFGAVLAADFGTFALGIDRDVDAAVATTRVELLHAIGSTAVAVLAAGVAYAVFEATPSGSGLGVIVLLFVAVVLALAVRA